MFCTNCGKQLVDGAYACPYCGNVVESAIKSVHVDETSAEPSVDQNTVATPEPKAPETPPSSDNVPPTAPQQQPQQQYTPQPQYNPYAQQPQYQPSPPQSVRTHPLTIIGFIFSFGFLLFPLLEIRVLSDIPFLLTIAGLIISIVARKKIAKDPSIAGNRGLTTAGIVLSIIGISLYILIFIIAIILVMFSILTLGAIM